LVDGGGVPFRAGLGGRNLVGGPPPLVDGVVHPLGSGHRFHGELCSSAGEFAHPLEHEVGGAVGGGDVGGEQAPPLRGPFGGAVGRCGGQGEDRELGVLRQAGAGGEDHGSR